MSHNSVAIDGNLVDDPQLVELPDGKYVCNFTIANNAVVRGEQVLNGYFDIRVFDGNGTQARNVARTLKKGERVEILGRLNQQLWTKADGSTDGRIRIIADAVGLSLQFAAHEPAARKPKEAAPEAPAEDEAPAAIIAE